MHHGVPHFGEVQQVLIIDEVLVVFKYKILRVTEYVSHLNAYKVTPGNEMLFVNISFPGVTLFSL